MAILDGIRDAIDRLTGEKERQAEKQREAHAKLEADRRQAAENKIAERIAIEEKVESQKRQAEKDRKITPGPIQRLRQQEITRPEPTVEKPEKKVAERMELKPAGLQPRPSIGGPGDTFTNPRVWKPQQQNQLDQTLQQINADRQKELERIAKLTPEQMRIENDLKRSRDQGLDRDDDDLR